MVGPCHRVRRQLRVQNPQRGRQSQRGDHSLEEHPQGGGGEGGASAYAFCLVCLQRRKLAAAPRGGEACPSTGEGWTTISPGQIFHLIVEWKVLC